MKKILLTLASMALCVAVVNAQAINGSYPGGKGIKNSPHNMSYSSSFGGGTTSAQMCVFCHTPHNKIITAPTNRLWNHTINPGTSYTGSFTTGSYSSMNPSGVYAPSAKFLGSTSLACLSCHDGLTAITDLKNAIWEVSAGTDVAPLGSATHLNSSNSRMINNENGTGPLLGTDLSDDHPVGVEYRTYAATNLSGGNPIAAGQVDDALLAASMNQNFGATVGSATTGNLLKYTNPFTTFPTNMPKMSARLYINEYGSGKPQVECTSCHQVHNSGGFKKLLRIDNDQSKLCLDCHISK